MQKHTRLRIAVQEPEVLYLDYKDLLNDIDPSLEPLDYDEEFKRSLMQIQTTIPCLICPKTYLVTVQSTAKKQNHKPNIHVHLFAIMTTMNNPVILDHKSLNDAIDILSKDPIFNGKDQDNSHNLIKIIMTKDTAQISTTDTKNYEIPVTIGTAIFLATCLIVSPSFMNNPDCKPLCTGEFLGDADIILSYIKRKGGIEEPHDEEINSNPHTKVSRSQAEINRVKKMLCHIMNSNFVSSISDSNGQPYGGWHDNLYVEAMTNYMILKDINEATLPVSAIKKILYRIMILPLSAVIDAITLTKKDDEKCSVIRIDIRVMHYTITNITVEVPCGIKGAARLYTIISELERVSELFAIINVILNDIEPVEA